MADHQAWAWLFFPDTTRSAMELADADYELRETAAACGFDPDKATRRAEQIWRETLLRPVAAMDKVRGELLEAWARGGTTP